MSDMNFLNMSSNEMMGIYPSNGDLLVDELYARIDELEHDVSAIKDFCYDRYDALKAVPEPTARTNGLADAYFLVVEYIESEIE